MINRKAMLGASSGLLALGFVLGSGAAAAQTSTSGPHGHGHGAPLKGVVQNLGQGSFQINVNGTATTVTFSSTTRVARTVSGSTADLTKGAHVDLQLASGGNTVKGVNISPVWTSGSAKPAKGGAQPWTGTGHHGDHAGKPGTGTPKANSGAPKFGTKHNHPATGASAHAGGQVVSFNASTGALTLQGRDNQTATYSVPGNVKVTKIVAGKTSDLANGETVQVFAPTGGTAVLIAILSA